MSSAISSRRQRTCANHFRAVLYIAESLEQRLLLSVMQITTDNADHRWPALNDGGDFVYCEQVGGFWQVFENGGAITSDSYNHMFPDIDNNGDVLWYQDGSSAGPEVVERVGGTDRVIQFSSMNPISGAFRDAGMHAALASNGNNITSYTFDDGLGDPEVHRFVVNGGTLGGDFVGFDSPDINSHNQIVFSDGSTIYDGPASGTAAPLIPGQIGRINDSGTVVVSNTDVAGPIHALLAGNASNPITLPQIGASADLNDANEIVFAAPDSHGVTQLFEYEPSPDLSARLVVASLPADGKVMAGQTIHPTVEATNLGLAPAVGTIKVDFYLSPDQTTSDALIDVPLSSQSVDVAPGSAKTFTADLQIPPTVQANRNYYMIADVDSSRNLPDSSFDNNSDSAALQVTDCGTVDLSPLMLRGSFVHDDTTGVCTATGMIDIGLKPATGGVFSPIVTVNGIVNYDNQVISGSGVVTSDVGGVNAALFAGAFEIPVHSFVGMVLSGASPGTIQIAGQAVTVSQFQIDPSNSAIHLAGTFLLPPDLGGLQLAPDLDGNLTISAPPSLGIPPFSVQVPGSLLIDSDGIGLTVSAITLPNVDLGFKGLTLSASSLSLSYDFGPDILNVRGKFGIDFKEPAGSGQRHSLSADVDLTGGNYFSYSPTRNPKFQLVGALSVENQFPLFADWFVPTSLQITFDTVRNSYSGTARVEVTKGALPGEPPRVITMTAAFQYGGLNSFSFDEDNLNIKLPLRAGLLSLYLQRFGGAIQHLSLADPAPAVISANLGMTYGPEVQIGQASVFVLRLDTTVAATIASASTITGQFSLRAFGGLAIGSAECTYDENLGTFTADGTLNAYNGLIVFQGRLTAGNGSLTGSGTATAQLPVSGTPIPIVAAAAAFRYVAGQPLATDYIAAWKSLPVPPNSTVPIGVKADLNGDPPQLLNATNLPPVPSPQIIALPSRAASTALAESFAVPTGSRFVVLNANWTIPATRPPITIQGPDGTVYAIDHLPPNMGVLQDLSGQTRATMAVVNPSAGSWTINISDVTGLGAVQFAAVGSVLAADLAVTGPSGSTAGGSVPIHYQATDPNPNATVDLYYDTTGSGNNGMLIVSGLPVDTGSFTWDTTPVPAGDYHLYAVLSDDAGIPAFAYAPGTVHVAAGVVGRHIFYNESAFDGNNPAPGASDDNAIATDKTPLFRGTAASFANYTSYDKGINGIMVDIAGLATPLAAADFDFRVGNTDSPGSWAQAPAPTDLNIRPGAGADGSTRVTITWPDGSILNEWLQVTVNADTATGLSQPDVFYFGNAVGNSGHSTTNARVTFADEQGARNDPHSFMNPAPITNVHDYNRDGRVDAIDQIIARDNFTPLGAGLQLIDVPDQNMFSATITWASPNGGDWGNPSNWDAGRVPGPNDDVLIDTANPINVTFSSGTLSVHSLFSTDVLTLAGGTLAGGNIILGSTARLIANGDITLDQVTLNADLSEEDGTTLTIVNGLTLNSTLTLSGSADTYTDLFFSGTQTLSGTGQIVMSDTPAPSHERFLVGGNAAPVTLTIGPDIRVTGAGLITHYVAPGAVVNLGTVTADDQAEPLTINLDSLSNGGTLSANNGATLDVAPANPWSSSGSLLCGSGSTMLLETAIDNPGQTLTVSGPGSFGITNATLPAGAVVNGTDGAHLVVSGVVSGSNVTLDRITLNTDLLQQVGTTITVVDGLTLNGVLTMLGTPDSYTDLFFSGTQSLLGTGEIVMSDTPAPARQRLLVGGSGSPATLTVATGIRITGAGLVTYYVSPGTLVNSGMITADDASEPLTINLDSLSNLGTIQAVNGATLALDPPTWTSVGTLSADGNATVALGGTFSVMGKTIVSSGSTITAGGGFNQTGGTSRVDGTLDVGGSVFDLEDGSMSGTGTVLGNLTNDGEIAPGGNSGSTGTLRIQGRYNQGSGGLLRVGLAGNAAGTLYDQLAVTDQATIAGILRVSLSNGFLPTAGRTFQILTAGSLVGTFTTASGANGGIMVNPSYNVGQSPASVEISVTAALPGDANRDGTVNFADLLTLAQNYGATNASWADGDFNGDGTVGFPDLLTLAQNYGRAAAQGAATVWNAAALPDGSALDLQRYGRAGRARRLAGG